MRSVLFLPSRLHSNTSPPHVADILAHTQAEELKNVYNLPTFNTTLEFTKTLALNTGHLLKCLPFLSSLAYCQLLITSHRELTIPSQASSYMLESGRWRELGVAGPKAEEAALTSIESLKHRS